MAQLQHVEISAPHGRLEGLLRLPDQEGASSMVAVVCHPHPVYGGTMHNKTVFRLAQALNAVGMPALRFNFRGVGESSGSYDNGQGEQDDVRAALDYVQAHFPDAPLCVAGFSFGSWVGLPVGCADERVSQLVGAGVPVRLLSVEALARCSKPKLIVQGERDEHGPQAELLPWFESIPAPKHLEVVAGSDHFFTDHLDALSEAVTRYFKQQAEERGEAGGI